MPALLPIILTVSHVVLAADTVPKFDVECICRPAATTPVGRNARRALNAAEIRTRSDHQPSMQPRPNPLRSHEMLILLILIRSLRRRPQSFRPSRVQRVQNDPIPAMKAFLTGVAT